MTWLETRSSREFEKHLRYPETIGILFWCCIRKWSLCPNLGHFGPAIRGQSHLFHSKICQKLAKVLKKHLLQLFILVIIRHFHCKIYRNLSKIWKKRLVQVKHIYSGSFFPGNKIASVYRSWHRFCQKSRFSKKSKIPSNDEILREISQESIEICTPCSAIQ